MAFNFWCVAPSHPIVKQIANKYGLTIKQAKTIINTARKEDTTLNDDDLELSDIEDNDAFKSALGIYVQSEVDSKYSLFSDPKRISKTREEFAKELDDEELGLSDEQKADALDRFDEIHSTVNLPSSSRSLAKVLSAFKSTKRLDFIGNYMVRRISEVVTRMQTDDEFREDNGVKKHNTRQEYFIDPDSWTSIIKEIEGDFQESIEILDDEGGNEELITELETALDNYKTILFMYGGEMFRDEGVQISLSGTVVSDENSESDSATRNDVDENGDENGEEDEDTNEEQKLPDFSASKQHKSVTSKIVPDIKVLIGNCRELDRDGNEITENPYHLPEYVSVPHAVQMLLQTCMGCQTFGEMYDAIKDASEGNKWMTQLLDALDSSYGYDMGGATEVSSSRKEQLQTMAFQSLRKQFTKFMQTYVMYDADGNMYLQRGVANVSHIEDSIMSDVKSMFANMAGSRIFKNGIIDFNYIRKLGERSGYFISNTAAGSISKLATSARSKFNDAINNLDAEAETKAIEEFFDVVQKMRRILSAFGIKVTNDTMFRYLNSPSRMRTESDKYVELTEEQQRKKAFNNMADNLVSMSNYVSNLAEEFLKWEVAIEREEKKERRDYPDNRGSNPFSNKKGVVTWELVKGIRDGYDGIVYNFAKSDSDSVESMGYMGGKTYYSWNNPSTVQTIIENLTRKDHAQVKEYMERKFGQDMKWFCKPESKPGALVFYSDILNSLYNGDNPALEYSEMPLVNGETYEDMSDLSYALSILDCYFTPIGRKSESAWYRMLIAGDKPRYSLLRLRRYTDENTEKGYKTVITEKAMNFFGQELRRSEDVARFNALDKEGTHFDGYDPKRTADVQAVYDKMKAKKKVTHADVVKNGRYIFRGTGVSFYLNKFINSEIEKNSELGAYVIDKIFNSHMSKKPVYVMDDHIIKVFKSAFENYMDGILENYMDRLESIGLFEKRIQVHDGKKEAHLKYTYGSQRQWHRGDRGYESRMYTENMESAMRYAIEHDRYDEERYIADDVNQTYYAEIIALRDDLKEFVYNNWLAKVETSEIFDVDLAFYGDTGNFQKRNAQIISSGYPVDPDAQIHGDTVTDGYYRNITIKTEKIRSKHIKNVEVALRKELKNITDPNQRALFEAGIQDVVRALSRFDPTDGQGLTSLSGLRKRMIGLGEWSRSETQKLDDDGVYRDEKGNIMTDEERNPQYVFTHEAVYNRFLRSWSKPEDAGAKARDLMFVFAQPQKPFVYTYVNVKREGRTVTVPVQLKNSEYCIAFASSFMMSVDPDCPLAAIARFMEDTAKENPKKGVDTVNFDSAKKIGGNDRVIDLRGLSGPKVLAKLKKSTIDKNGGYIPGAVDEYDVRDYKIVQKKPEHFKHNQQPLGSQMKILSINNIPDDAAITLKDGSTINGKELKKRYFDALRKKAELSERKFRKSLGLNRPGAARKRRLSDTLKAAMSADVKFSVDMRRGLSIVFRDGEDQFYMPLDDPSQQSSIEAMLISKIRKAFYKEKTNGGVVVQATSWGASSDLNIRFKSTNPADKDGLVPTQDEFAKRLESKRKYGTRTGLSGEELDKAYQNYVETEYGNYLNEYQGDYAYFECEIPMPDYVRKMLLDKKGNVDKKYINEDGTWNMDAIKKVVPDSAFDAICYRIPTEAKYSMMVCRVVRFAPEGAGSVAKYPLELTEFTGSDFDIDTDFVELRPIPGSGAEAIDNDIFDLQMAALRSGVVRQETFKRGDFSDLSEESYRDVLYRKASDALTSNGLTEEMIDAMSFDEAKEACKNAEDLDLMDPSTDIILRNQNADAGKMIGIAAVGVISHAFVSTFNEYDINDAPSGEKVSGNFTRILIPKTSNDDHSFTVINDNDPSNVTERVFSGYTILDPMHDMDGALVSTQLSKYVGASADAAKDAALYRLNITATTLPILATMHRLGVSAPVARKFISQPIIRKVVGRLNSMSAFGNASIKDAVEQVGMEIAMADPQFYVDGEFDRDSYDRMLEQINKDENKTLRYSELKENILHPDKQSTYDKLVQMNILINLDETSKSIRNLDSFSRYNSTTAMRGSTFFERYVARSKVRRLQHNLEKENPIIALPDNVEPEKGFAHLQYGKLLTMFPHVGRVIKGEGDLIDDIILENMHTYSLNFFRAAEILQLADDEDLFGDKAVKKLQKLYSGWKNYLLFVGPNRIADFHNKSTFRRYTINFADNWHDFLEDLEKNNKELYDDLMENNTFIKSIGFTESKDGYVPFNILNTKKRVTRLSGTAAETFKRDWEALLDIPEFDLPGGRSWATELAIYFLARSASFANDTPVHLLPNKIKESIPNYTKAFEEADRYVMSDNELSNFIQLFLLQNDKPEDGIMPRFYNSQKKSVGIDVVDKKSGLVALTFDKKYSGMIQKWTSINDAARTFDVPVIAITENGFSQLYLIVDNTVEENGTGDNKVYTVKAMPVDPIGIPYQMSEYVGYDFSVSMFRDVNEAVPQTNDGAENNAMETPAAELNADIEMPRIAADRGGTFIETSPFYDDVVSANYTRMARDIENTNNGYLETRTHLIRAQKIIKAAGLKSEAVHRIVSKTGPEYLLNVKRGDKSTDQHKEAVRAAAMITALGTVSTNTRVKTYVTDPNGEFSHLELSIKLDPNSVKAQRFSKLHSNLDFLMKRGTGKYSARYDSETDELQLTVDVSGRDATVIKKNVDSAIEHAKKISKYLKDKGFNVVGEVTASPVMIEDITPDDAIEILKEIKNEEENLRNPASKAKEHTESRGSETGNKVRIVDIIDIAERRRKGENVTERLRELFNERRFPLRHPESSYESGRIIDEVKTDLDKDVIDAVMDMFNGSNKVDPVKRVNNLIINTANWILSNRPESALKEKMSKDGVSEENADSIIVKIKDILEKFNIC